MVQGNAHSPEIRCLSVAPIFFLMVMKIMTLPKHHRYAQEFMLRFACELLYGYYSIIKIYMTDSGSKKLVFHKENNAYF